MSARAAFVVLLAACVRTPPVPITVGPAHELLVPVVIDHHAIVLQLDTGASTTALTPAACRKLGLAIDQPFIAGNGATGPLRHVDRTVLGMTTIGSFTIANLSAAVIDLGSGAGDGVLGMNALSVFTVEVDLAHDRFALYARGDGPWRTPDLVGVPYARLANGQIALPVDVDGRRAIAILDLGANESYANELAAPRRDESRVVHATIGADGHPWQFRGIEDVDVRIGAVSTVAPLLLVSDLPIFRDFGLATLPAVLLGTDALAGRRIVISPFDGLVYVSSRGP
jgi:hypothetical protein